MNGIEAYLYTLAMKGGGGSSVDLSEYAKKTEVIPVSLKSQYDGAVTTANSNKSKLDTLTGTGTGSITKQIADEIAKIVGGAEASFDTLKEIADWISNHADDASAMNTAIQANTTAIGTKADKVTKVEKTSSDATIALDKTKFFVFPEMTTLTVTGTDGHFRFTSGTTATTLTLPANTVSDMVVESNRIYEVDIKDGYLAWTSWAVV